MMRERLGICEFYQVSTNGTKLLEIAWEILYDGDVPQVYIHQCDVPFNGTDESMESIFLLNYRNMEVWGVYHTNLGRPKSSSYLRLYLFNRKEVFIGN